MARETAESGAALRRLFADGVQFDRALAIVEPARAPFAVICGRGSSGHAGVFLRYLIETRLGLAVSATAPSVTTALQRPLKMRDALFVVISQSGASPDLVAATRAAHEAGARVLAIVNVEQSPVTQFADAVIALHAGVEHSVAATKSVVASMAAGAVLVARASGDDALQDALSRLPDRLDAAVQCDWAGFARLLEAAPCAFVTGRGLGLGSAREIALKMSETLRMPALGYSAAEIRHGPRAAISVATPVLGLRLGDATGADVDDVARDLRAAGVRAGICGGPHGDLPWIGDDHPTTDAIAMLAPAYRMIETVARAKGFDPDRPPHLSKVTQTL